MRWLPRGSRYLRQLIGSADGLSGAQVRGTLDPVWPQRKHPSCQRLGGTGPPTNNAVFYLWRDRAVAFSSATTTSVVDYRSDLGGQQDRTGSLATAPASQLLCTPASATPRYCRRRDGDSSISTSGSGPRRCDPTLPWTGVRRMCDLSSPRHSEYQASVPGCSEKSPTAGAGQRAADMTDLAFMGHDRERGARAWPSFFSATGIVLSSAPSCGFE